MNLDCYFNKIDFTRVIDLFFKGGPLMFPLLIGSICMLAIIIERIIVFSQTPIRFHVINRIKEQLTYTAFIDPVLMKQKGQVEKLIFDIVKMKSAPREVIERNVSIKGDIYLHKLEKHLHLLELIGRMAPMVGLLGTVMGMVEAFMQVALVKTVVDPSILAAGIWEALITTAFGLIVGIPSFIAFHLFTTRLERVAFHMKTYSEEIISLMKDKNG